MRWEQQELYIFGCNRISEKMLPLFSRKKCDCVLMKEELGETKWRAVK
jgi:hypothetical protein